MPVKARHNSAARLAVKDLVFNEHPPTDLQSWRLIGRTEPIVYPAGGKLVNIRVYTRANESALFGSGRGPRRHGRGLRSDTEHAGHRPGARREMRVLSRRPGHGAAWRSTPGAHKS